MAGAPDIFRRVANQEGITIYELGDSMYPIIKAGDLVAFKQIHDVANIIPGEKYIIGIDLEGDEHILIKYLQRSSQGDDYLSLISYNENHQTIDITKDRIKSIAIIKAILRFETNSWLTHNL